MARLSPRAAGFAAILASLAPLPAAASEAYVAYVAADSLDSADTAARDAAIARAEEEALATVLQRLTAARDHPRLPVATGPNVAGYIADATVLSDGSRLRIALRPDAVAQMLDGFGIAYLDTLAPLLVVVPVYAGGGEPMLWSGPNPWLDAWGVHPGGAGLVPVVVPFAEFGDLQAVNADEALAGDAVALRRIAERYDAAGTLVAAYSPTASEVRLAVATADGWQAQTVLSLPPGGSPPPAVVDAALAAVGRLWVEDALQPSYQGPVSTLQATASFGSLADWIAIRRALDEAPIVERFDVPLVSGTTAQLVLHHYADMPSLQRDLAGAGVVIEQGGFSATGLPGLTLRLARPAAAAPQPPDPFASAAPGWSASAEAPLPQTLTIEPRIPTLRLDP